MARILAIASGGGHWEQLLIISAAFDGHEVSFANTLDGLAERSGIAECRVISDCNRDQPLASLRSAWDSLALILRIRPEIVVTTGAAPGLIALFWGRLLGARTIWIDSVANSEQLSMSGKIARRIAHLHLTQWQHVAEAAGGKTRFLGSVL